MRGNSSRRIKKFKEINMSKVEKVETIVQDDEELLSEEELQDI